MRDAARRLERWYRHAHRRLPWRAAPGRCADAYRVLVSESMLQQTQVATVQPYFGRFVARFPTLASLARADLQDVLKLWQGLGYYHRARHLHAAAGAIVAQHGGRVPSSVEELLRLPGVGRYTAGAIASLAFGRPAPVLDGNVMRVLARWRALRWPVDQPGARTALWNLSAGLVRAAAHPGDLNQALMELGATLCTPRSPRCAMCPLSDSCAALRLGVTDSLPRRRRRGARPVVEHHVLAVERRGRWLFEQRGAGGLWAGLWQLPTLERADGPVDATTLATWAGREMGVSLGAIEAVTRFTHDLTHRRVRFVLWRAQATGGRVRRGASAARRWGSASDAADLPMAVPQRRALAMVTRLGDLARGAEGDTRPKGAR